MRLYFVFLLIAGVLMLCAAANPGGGKGGRKGGRRGGGNGQKTKKGGKGGKKGPKAPMQCNEVQTVPVKAEKLLTGVELSCRNKRHTIANLTVEFDPPNAACQSLPLDRFAKGCEWKNKCSVQYTDLTADCDASLIFTYRCARIYEEKVLTLPATEPMKTAQQRGVVRSHSSYPGPYGDSQMLVFKKPGASKQFFFTIWNLKLGAGDTLTLTATYGDGSSQQVDMSGTETHLDTEVNHTRVFSGTLDSVTLRLGSSSSGDGEGFIACYGWMKKEVKASRLSQIDVCDKYVKGCRRSAKSKDGATGKKQKHGDGKTKHRDSKNGNRQKGERKRGGKKKGGGGGKRNKGGKKKGGGGGKRNKGGKKKGDNGREKDKGDEGGSLIIGDWRNMDWKEA